MPLIVIDIVHQKLVKQIILNKCGKRGAHICWYNYYVNFTNKQNTFVFLSIFEPWEIFLYFEITK